MLSLLLVFALVFEIIHLTFSQDHIKVANNIIINYQKRRVSERYIERLLEEIEELWDLDWDRLQPIFTESMIKEAQVGERRDK